MRLARSPQRWLALVAALSFSATACSAADQNTWPQDTLYTERGMRTVLTVYFDDEAAFRARLDASFAELTSTEAALVRPIPGACGGGDRGAECERVLRTAYERLCPESQPRRIVCDLISNIGVGEDYLRSPQARREPRFAGELRQRRSERLRAMEARLQVAVRR